MQVSPLFHEDLESLLKSLRLSGVDQKGDSHEVVEDCVRDFRVWLVQRMGLSAVTSLAGVTYTETPTTEEQARRMAARTLEREWVWCHAIEKLQVLFADASGAAFQQFNDESVWRQFDALDRNRLLAKCREHIGHLLDYITGQLDFGDAAEVQAFDGTPEVDVCPAPGKSLAPWLRTFTGIFEIPAVRFGEID